ncbi:hypothetical protein OG986_18995 [Streptomyces cellulosae]|uniref:Uncharacterized protein n=1 Tax=Streptomyces thermodiastaticus TaxID=44061 RepID=A0ABU0KF86_9ACTN|nr:hypothetical protein [Streptomyces thermodiastaticus]THC56740.1 hypothetical protein E7X38_11660 [Streptomyces sp. Akac8]UVT11149.1 hypothetical protein AY578_18870 [Streptomyces thermocarboxydus]WSB42885.1 hypothetical protein OG853_19430 [Streptomyces cellulosae]WSB48410.1 hypothetical protein OHA00_14145 [Streptomyces cellulosae]
MTVTPVDYELLLPEGWFRVGVEPESRERSVDALVDRRFGGADNVPHLKRRLREELLAQAAAAYDQGGIELYLSMQQAGALTVPASLLVTLLPPGSVTEAADASAVELAAGTAVRRRGCAGAGRGDGETLPSVTLDYQVPVPGTGAHLLLTFSTPLVQIADTMVELFDAVAGSLRWRAGSSGRE